MGSDDLKEILKEFSLKDAFEVEKRDRQYKALEKLYDNLKDEELFFKLVLINALLSYQLPTRGEVYWENFSRFFSGRKSPEDFEEFLKLHNSRFLTAKLKRLKKVLKLVKGIPTEKFKDFCKNPKKLLLLLSRKLRQEPSAKTIVFAIKMFIYACRIAGYETATAPFDIDIPLDVRLKKISSDRTYWKTLAKEVNIPPLHLDALIWTTLGADDHFIETLDDTDLKEKLRKLREILKNIVRTR